MWLLPIGIAITAVLLFVPAPKGSSKSLSYTDFINQVTTKQGHHGRHQPDRCSQREAHGWATSTPLVSHPR